MPQVTTVEAIADGLSRAISMNKHIQATRAIDIDDIVGLILDFESMPYRRMQILEAVKILLAKYGIEVLDSKTDPTGERSKA